MTTHGDNRDPDDFSRPPSTDGDGSLFDTPLANTRITQAQLADLLGVSRQAVNKQVRRGAVRVDADRMMPARRGLADWKANVDPSRTRARFTGKRSAATDPEILQRVAALEQRVADDLDAGLGPDGPVAGSTADSRAKLYAIQLERAKFAHERDQGQWVRKAAVEAAIGGMTAVMHRAYQELPQHITYHLGLEYPHPEGKLVHEIVERLARGWYGELVRELEAVVETDAGE